MSAVGTKKWSVWHWHWQAQSIRLKLWSFLVELRADVWCRNHRALCVYAKASSTETTKVIIALYIQCPPDEWDTPQAGVLCKWETWKFTNLIIPCKVGLSTGIFILVGHFFFRRRGSTVSPAPGLLCRSKKPGYETWGIISWLYASRLLRQNGPHLKFT